MSLAILGSFLTLFSLNTFSFSPSFLLGCWWHKFMISCYCLIGLWCSFFPLILIVQMRYFYFSSSSLIFFFGPLHSVIEHIHPWNFILQLYFSVMIFLLWFFIFSIFFSETFIFFLLMLCFFICFRHVCPS